MKTMTSADPKTPQPVTRRLLVVAVATALVLLVPLAAMQFTSEVNWDLYDFAVAGALIGGTGLLYVLLTRKPSNTRQRLMVGAVLLLALVVVWAELAVGIFD